MISFKYYLLENKKNILIISISVLICLLTICFLIYTKKTVTFLTEYDKKQVQVYGFATTADALAKADIRLSPYDELTASLDKYIKNNDTIYILKKTADGSIVSTVSDISTVEVSSKLDEIVVENAAVAEGGNVIETSGGTLSYSHALEVVATAYCPCSICCGPYDGTSTADGSTPQAYHTLATSSTYAFGTNIYIPYFDDQENHGLFEVEDRGGAIQGDKIDVFFNTHQEALNFGRKTFMIYILN